MLEEEKFPIPPSPQLSLLCSCDGSADLSTDPCFVDCRIGGSSNYLLPPTLWMASDGLDPNNFCQHFHFRSSSAFLIDPLLSTMAKHTFFKDDCEFCEKCFLQIIHLREFYLILRLSLWMQESVLSKMVQGFETNHDFHSSSLSPVGSWSGFTGSPPAFFVLCPAWKSTIPN